MQIASFQKSTVHGHYSTVWSELVISFCCWKEEISRKDKYLDIYRINSRLQIIIITFRSRNGHKRDFDLRHIVLRMIVNFNHPNTLSLDEIPCEGALISNHAPYPLLRVPWVFPRRLHHPPGWFLCSRKECSNLIFNCSMMQKLHFMYFRGLIRVNKAHF